VPRYLTEADTVWLEELLAECERYVGRRRGELEERLREPLVSTAPRDKVAVASGVLLREYRDRTESPVAPALIRAALFSARSREATNSAALERACQQLGLVPGQIEANLFADLPSERRLAALEHPLSSAELALRANHAIVAALLKKATEVRIEAEGNVRALVSATKLRGLLCNAEPLSAGERSGAESVRLVVSGPYALFRHTLVYGRALVSLLPRVARCRRFVLQATCALANERDRSSALVELTVKSGDPIVPAASGKTYDSKLEERFARDFGKLALDWEIVREPEAIAVDGAWIFPDFLLRHRRQPERQALLEIVGYWTPDYLDKKLRTLEKAKLGRFILCIDRARNCTDSDLPNQARVIQFQRRVPAEQVLELLERRF
jgi:hypothetical protein